MLTTRTHTNIDGQEDIRDHLQAADFKASDFIYVFDTAKPALLLLFQYLDWKTIFRIGKTCKSLYNLVRSQCQQDYGKPFGDESLIQTFDLKTEQIIWKTFDVGDRQSIKQPQNEAAASSTINVG